MRILLCSSALVAASAFPVLSAEWEVGLSGFYHLGVGLSDGNNQSGLGVLRDGEVHFDGTLTADNGLRFFARVELEAQTDEDQIDKNFGGVETSLGTFKIGGDDTAIATYHNGVLGAPGGIMGYYDADFITTAADDMGAVAGGEQGVGFHYDTPEFMGFQAGISYIPSLSADEAGDTNEPVFEENDAFYSIAAAYNGEVRGIGLGLSGGYADENGPDNAVWNVGGYVSFAGVTVAGGYQDAGDDYTDSASAGQSFYVGAEYATGPWVVAGGYSNNDFNDTDVAAAWATYKWVPGVATTIGIEYGDDGADEDVGGVAYLSLNF
ncbi:MAG: porin [Pseudomonadota bacterium]